MNSKRSHDWARDRVIVSFMTGLGLVSDPKQSSYRKWFAKATALVIVIDDIYDVYGYLEELQHFTNAVDRLGYNHNTTSKLEIYILMSIANI